MQLVSRKISVIYCVKLHQNTTTNFQVIRNFLSGRKVNDKRNRNLKRLRFATEHTAANCHQFLVISIVFHLSWRHTDRQYLVSPAWWLAE